MAKQFVYIEDTSFNVWNLIELKELVSMKHFKQIKIREKFPVIAYVDPTTFSHIEALRGDVSRSRFVGKIIKKSFEQQKIENNITKDNCLRFDKKRDLDQSSSAVLTYERQQRRVIPVLQARQDSEGTGSATPSQLKRGARGGK